MKSLTVMPKELEWLEWSIKKTQRKIYCHRCMDNIFKGDLRLEIPNDYAGHRGTKKYCVDCAKEILENSRNDVTLLMDKLTKGEEFE